MEPLYLDSDIVTGVSASAFGLPEKFYWERSIPNGASQIVTTELPKIDLYPLAKVYGWIIEPRDIDPNTYRYAEEHFQKFEKIYTHEKKLLNTSNKFSFIPCASCFISSKDRRIYSKNKFVSMVSSLKQLTANHLLRVNILRALVNHPKVDLFGVGFNAIENKCIGMAEYMFSIAIENQTSEFYFTEKIIDCFLTGAIPLYFGCPEINRFFNPDGIIKFKTMEELMSLINDLTPDTYLSKMSAVKENYLIAQRYATPDNLLYDDFRFENKVLDRYGSMVF